MTEKQIEALAQKLAVMEHKSLHQVFNPKHLKMHMMKQALNYTVGMTKGLLPETKPTFPITQILDKTFANAITMSESLGDWHDDKNFPRFVETLRRLLIFIAEEDGYYRGWLEMFLMMLNDNLNEMPRP